MTCKYLKLIFLRKNLKDLLENHDLLVDDGYQYGTSWLKREIPIEDKKTNGAFFTPSFIVDYIIKEVNPQLNETVKCALY